MKNITEKIGIFRL